MLRRVGAKPSSVDARSYLPFVIGAFTCGWLLGLFVIFKVWHLAHAPRWMMCSEMGYVSLMMAPSFVGFGFARVVGRLASRGWRGAPLGLFGLGVCGLVAGLLAL
ncbi:MAG TPA: hypothetical protein VLT58_05515 [Polyangia bacterium]|nr:hypothetical protein [Polyangia bacterium]